jgi:hypothetical protein
MLPILGNPFFGAVNPFNSLRLHTFLKEGKVETVYIKLFR